MLYLVLDVKRNRARTDESFAAAGRQVAVLEDRVVRLERVTIALAVALIATLALATPGLRR